VAFTEKALSKAAKRVSSVLSIEASAIWAQGKDHRAAARSLLCYCAVKDLVLSMAYLSRRLNLSIAGISVSDKRGEKGVQDKDYQLLETKL